MSRSRTWRRLLSASGVLLFMLIAVPAFTQVQTADVSKRGLTDKDFPRTIKLAANVYAFELLALVHPAAPAAASQERYTTNSLVVITTEGVLVGDGQGNPEFAN